MRVSEYIKKLVPYSPGKPIEETKREFGVTEVFKLASNENPLGPSPLAVEAIQRAVSDLHRYPDAANYDLIQSLSQKFNVPAEHFVCGNGSNELIDLLIRVFCEPGDRVLMSELSFVAYPICAQAARVEQKVFPLRAGYRFDSEKVVEYLRTTNDEKDRILFIANPNNPTGTYINHEELEKILEATKGRTNFLVVVDEAYTEFVRAKDYPKAFELQKKYPQMVILRTMSKVYGLAGLRIGFLVAAPEVVQYLNRVRNPFNVNSLAQAAAVAALKDEAYLKKSREIVWQGLDYFYKNLSEMRLDYVESQANFVLFKTQMLGEQLAHELLKQGVILRALKGYALPHHLRMSVGLPSENEAAIRALKKVLKI